MDDSYIHFISYIYVSYFDSSCHDCCSLKFSGCKTDFGRYDDYNAGVATFYAVYLPFILGIPLQTGTLVTYFGNYTSVIFQSTCNFFAPFLIFLFLSKRKLGIFALIIVLGQSVLDEVCACLTYS